MKEFWAIFYRHWATINSSLLVTLTDEQSVGPEPLPPKKSFAVKKLRVRFMHRFTPKKLLDLNN